MQAKTLHRANIEKVAKDKTKNRTVSQEIHPSFERRSKSYFLVSNRVELCLVAHFWFT